MSTNIEDMTEQELADLIEAAREALARRQSLEAVDREMGDALQKARASGVLPTPEPAAEWVAPADVTDAYTTGDTVTHDGATWTPARAVCICPPGHDQHWSEVPDD